MTDDVGGLRGNYKDYLAYNSGAVPKKIAQANSISSLRGFRAILINY